MPSINEICDSVADAMRTIPLATVARVQSYDELTSGMNTVPTIQVYPERWETDAATETDRTTFVDALTGVPGVRQCEVLIRVDVFVRQRSQIGEDLSEAVTVGNAVQNKLEEQGTCPPLFDLEGIQSMRWTAQRVVFDYATILYAGWRFELSLRIF